MSLSAAQCSIRTICPSIKSSTCSCRFCVSSVPMMYYRHFLSTPKDAPFNTVDALMAETAAKSFPEVSQSLWFERKWPSL